MPADRPSIVSAEIAAYLRDHAEPPDEVLQGLQRRTAELGGISMMQVSAEEGALLTLLTRLVGASQAIEIGTFTGYSSICIARGLAEAGRLTCCDVSEEYTAIARDAWHAADLQDRIELRIGPALETLRSLPTDVVFDLAFVDADKEGYVGYFEELVPRLRPGGLLLVDNTLWSGQVAKRRANDDRTVAIRTFNDHVAADVRVDSVIVPISDGLTLIRKR